jgi:hypothetical protein
MAENNKFYEVYRGLDSLTPGEKLKIEHHVSLTRDQINLSELVPLPLVELEKRRADSTAYERVLYEQLIKAAGKWEEQAAITLLLDKAIEYDKTPAAAHSANSWRKDENGDHSVSNAVYKMRYRVYEQTRYDREKQASVPVSWLVDWSVYTNSPPKSSSRGYSNIKIAGQNRKRFTDKSAMEKYVKGRIAAYAGLFTEISPPIPQELEKYFTVNDLLLPGYRVAGNERTVIAVADAERPKESVLARIAKGKAERGIKASERDKPAPGKKKRRDEEL